MLLTEDSLDGRSFCKFNLERPALKLGFWALQVALFNTTLLRIILSQVS